MADKIKNETEEKNNPNVESVPQKDPNLEEFLSSLKEGGSKVKPNEDIAEDSKLQEFLNSPQKGVVKSGLNVNVAEDIELQKFIESTKKESVEPSNKLMPEKKNNLPLENRAESREGSQTKRTAKKPKAPIGSSQKVFKLLEERKEQLKSIEGEVQQYETEGKDTSFFLDRKEKLIREIDGLSERITGEKIIQRAKEKLEEQNPSKKYIIFRAPNREALEKERKRRMEQGAERKIIKEDYENAKRIILAELPKDIREEYEKNDTAFRRYLAEQGKKPEGIDDKTYFRMIANGIRVDQAQKEKMGAHLMRGLKSVGIATAGGVGGILAGSVFFGPIGTILGAPIGAVYGVKKSVEDFERWEMNVPIEGGESISFRSQKEFESWLKEEQKKVSGYKNEKGQEIAGDIEIEAKKRADYVLASEEITQLEAKDIQREVEGERAINGRVIMHKNFQMKQQDGLIKKDVNFEQWVQDELALFRSFAAHDVDTKVADGYFYSMLNAGYTFKEIKGRMRVSLDGKNFVDLERKVFVKMMMAINDREKKKIEHETQERESKIHTYKQIKKAKEESRQEIWTKAYEKAGAGPKVDEAKSKEATAEKDTEGKEEAIAPEKEGKEKSLKNRIAKATNLDELYTVLTAEGEISIGSKGKKPVRELIDSIKEIAKEVIEKKKVPSKNEVIKKRKITTAAGIADTVYELLRDIVEKQSKKPAEPKVKDKKEEEPMPENMADILTPENINEALHQGKEIKVSIERTRKSGRKEIDEGWIIKDINNNQVSLWKNGKMEFNYPLDEIIRINRGKSKPSVSQKEKAVKTTIDNQEKIGNIEQEKERVRKDIQKAIEKGNPVKVKVKIKLTGSKEEIRDGWSIVAILNNRVKVKNEKIGVVLYPSLDEIIELNKDIFANQIEKPVVKVSDAESRKKKLDDQRKVRQKTDVPSIGEAETKEPIPQGAEDILMSENIRKALENGQNLVVKIYSRVGSGERPIEDGWQVKEVLSHGVLVEKDGKTFFRPFSEIRELNKDIDQQLKNQEERLKTQEDDSGPKKGEQEKLKENVESKEAPKTLAEILEFTGPNSAKEIVDVLVDLYSEAENGDEEGNKHIAEVKDEFEKLYNKNSIFGDFKISDLKNDLGRQRIEITIQNILNNENIN